MRHGLAEQQDSISGFSAQRTRSGRFAVSRERRISRMRDDFLGDLVQFWGHLARFLGRRSRSSSSNNRPDPPDPAKHPALD